jgi:hypothetical protein
MSRTMRRMFLVVALLVVAAGATALLPPSAPGCSPYLSALTDVVASPAYATGCPDKGCDRGIDCVPSVGLKCIHFNGKGCTATTC